MFTTETQNRAREWIRILLPEVATRLVQEEIGRIKAEDTHVATNNQKQSGQAEQYTTVGEGGFPVDFAELVQETVAPHVQAMVRDMVRTQVATALPGMVERLVAEEIQSLTTGLTMTGSANRSSYQHSNC